MREKEKEESEKKEENNENQKNAEDEACEKIINNKDYYDILGITKETSNDDIKKAYKKLAIKFHPDKNKSPKAEEAFKKIATAYQTLTDPKKRELFDKYGSEEEYREKVYQERQQAYEDDFDPYDIFDMFFGNIDPEMLRRQRRRYARAHAHNVQINPKVAKFLPFIQLIPIFLMGDFNEFPYQYTYDVVINRNYIDMWNTCLKNNNKFCTLGEQYFGSFHWYLGTLVNNYFLRKLLMPISYTHSGGKFSQWEQYHIDHMFYINGDFTDIKPIYASMPSDDLLLDNSGIYASDHFPLFAVFKLK